MKAPTQLQTVLFALILTYLPHALWLPAWVSIFCLSLWLIRFLAEHKNWNPPGRFYLYTLTLLALTGVVVFWGGHFYGRDGGTCLLALMLAIKPFEIHSTRDQMITLFLGLFLLFTVILFAHNLLSGLYVFCCLILILAGFLTVNQTHSRVLSTIGQAFLLVLQGLPLALICFLVFPRLPGALVGLADTTPVNISGLSQRLSPGNLSSLVLSKTIVFRARFQGAVPENKDLYWRAAVLWEYEDNVWSKKKLLRPGLVGFQHKGREKGYTLTLEPTRQKMLPVLDLPLNTPELARMLPGLTLEAKQEVQKRIKYHCISSLDSALAPPGPAQIRQGLQLDRSRNPRTKQLLRSLNTQQANSKAVVAQVLDFFRESGLFYSLNPPLLTTRDPVDEFLFDTRTGYCAHFAQAFAWMMRFAGIPARIVVGYQGGELNPLGEYLIVRQSDAHAWVEIVLPGQGWTRIDPTRTVAPERIASGIRGLRQQAGSGPIFLIPQDHWLVQIAHQIRLGWDALNYTWYDWVVGYTFSRQNKLFSRLHLGESAWQSLRTVILILTASFVLLSGFLALVLFRHRELEQDQAKRCYNLFLRKLSKGGQPIYAQEGPQDLSRRVSRNNPAAASRVKQIVELYIQLRYAGNTDKKLLARLKKQVKRFRMKA